MSLGKADSFGREALTEEWGMWRSCAKGEAENNQMKSLSLATGTKHYNEAALILAVLKSLRIIINAEGFNENSQ